MKNTFVQPVSSQLYSFGSSEVIYDVPLQIDNISFCTQFDQQLRGVFSIPSQCQTAGVNTNQELDFCYPGEGYLTTTSNNYDCLINPDQHPFSLTPNYEFQETENPRKRRAETNANIRENTFVNKRKKNKTSTEFEDHQWVSRKQVPIKRSQKLSDKITILQKLVSPYGKTDTASVLEEAFVTIKFLQDQIQNLCETETTSQLDLRSRGLCLVPLSFYSGWV